jgi:alpha-amylase/alpha-mannosidase (GH57 family)
MTNRYICIHGHFYQPPRENPWLDEVEVQEGAYPYHDWNERISAECYARNTASRILDENKRIIQISNNYSKISFNFGPTLLSWMQRRDPEAYRAILEADKISQKNFSGHGSALAQVYNHMIMPLSNNRDKRTQVIWGIQDFESRFQRKPEGMWLAETAVDLETLDVLAEHGIKFTILAPGQAKRFRKIGEEHFKDAHLEPIDTRRPYLCRLPSGKTIAIFFYDGNASQSVAFEGLLNNGEAFANRLVSVFDRNSPAPQLSHIATDGESYGHHHKFGDMALAYCTNHIESNHLANMTVYGEYLEKFPPSWEAEIHENTSWSCAHGVERWRSDCGCKIGYQPYWHQQWRKPLREALDWLRDKMIPVYEQGMSAYATDAWGLRDRYIEIVLDRREENIDRFLGQYVRPGLNEDEKLKILRLLEMQYNAMLMYTSCGWFFDEITGIETIQILKYAARTIQLAREVDSIDLEHDFIALLENAPSNLPDIKNGSRAYRVYVQPSIVNLQRVGAHYALTSLFDEYPEEAALYCYTFKSEVYERREAGRMTLVVGRVWIKSTLTLKRAHLQFACLHMGDHNFVAGVDYFKTDADFDLMQQSALEAFSSGNIPQVISRINQYFHSQNYSLWHLFQREQQQILNRVLQATTEEIEASFRSIHEHHYSLMQIKHNSSLSLPKALVTVVEFIVFRDLSQELENETLNRERFENVIAEMKRWNFERDKKSLSLVASRRINHLMEKLERDADNIQLMETADFILKNLSKINLELDVWKAQNICFMIGKRIYRERKTQALHDAHAKDWVNAFESLSGLLKMRTG